MLKKTSFTLSILLASILFFGCDKDRGVNIFTVEQDMEFGESFKQEILANPTEYPVLPRVGNEDKYAYLESMMADILKSSKLKYGSTFKWEITIINSDVKNAFAVPGGKLFFYVGLFKYLDNDATLAGVLAHEMAHADLRHSTQQMTKAYGLETLIAIVLGDNQSAIEQIAVDMGKGLASLKFSRENEYDADRYSMYYLATTTKKYDPRGIADFFVKMLAESDAEATVKWLSTHPSDQERVNHVNEVWDNDSDMQSLKQSGYQKNETEYATFKNSF